MSSLTKISGVLEISAVSVGEVIAEDPARSDKRLPGHHRAILEGSNPPRSARRCRRSCALQGQPPRGRTNLPVDREGDCRADCKRDFAALNSAERHRSQRRDPASSLATFVLKSPSAPTPHPNPSASLPPLTLDRGRRRPCGAPFAVPQCRPRNDMQTVDEAVPRERWGEASLDILALLGTAIPKTMYVRIYIPAVQWRLRARGTGCHI
jgi:hypothetical protein